MYVLFAGIPSTAVNSKVTRLQQQDFVAGRTITERLKALQSFGGKLVTGKRKSRETLCIHSHQRQARNWMHE